MKVVLIIMMLGASDGGRAVHHVEFANVERCEAARAAIQIGFSTGYISNWKPVTVCAQTGF